MNVLIRILWFLFVGCWLGPLWLAGSILLMCTIVFFPFGAYLATKTWAVTVLKSNPREVVVNAQTEVHNHND